MSLLPSFLTLLRPRRSEPEPEPLPALQRLATLEADMYEVRAAIDSVQGTVRKLSGKIYRGVPLGDTVDANAATETDVGPPQPVDPYAAKADLYRRAQALRSNTQ